MLRIWYRRHGVLFTGPIFVASVDRLLTQYRRFDQGSCPIKFAHAAKIKSRKIWKIQTKMGHFAVRLSVCNPRRCKLSSCYDVHAVNPAA